MLEPSTANRFLSVVSSHLPFSTAYRYETPEQCNFPKLTFNNFNNNIEPEILKEGSADERASQWQDFCLMVQQIINLSADTGTKMILSSTLANILRDMPHEVIMSTTALCNIISGKHDVENFVLNTLGPTAYFFLPEGNFISKIADYFVKEISEFVSSLYPYAKPDNIEDLKNYGMFLMVILIAVRHTLTLNDSPQNWYFKIPPFIGNMLIKANTYWNTLLDLSHSKGVTNSTSSRDKGMKDNPVDFEVDTNIKVLWPTAKLFPNTTYNKEALINEISRQSIKPVLGSFSSNSTTHQNLTVIEMPVDKQLYQSSSFHEWLQTKIIDEIKHAENIEIFNCKNKNIITTQPEDGNLVGNIYMNTQCDAVANPTSHQKIAGPALLNHKSKKNDFPADQNIAVTSNDKYPADDSDTRLSLKMPLHSLSGHLSATPVTSKAVRPTPLLFFSALASSISQVYSAVIKQSYEAGESIGKNLKSAEQLQNNYSADGIIKQTQVKDLHGESRLESAASVRHIRSISTQSHSSRIFEDNKPLIHYLRKKGALEPRTKKKVITREELVAAVASHIYTAHPKDATKLKKTAGRILAGSDLYGGRKNEKISSSQASTVVGSWLFTTLFGESFSNIISKKIAEKYPSSTCTVDQLSEILLPEKNNNKNLFLEENIPPQKEEIFYKVLNDFANIMIPVFYFSDVSTRSMAIDSDEFAYLYTGSRYLSATGKLKDSTPQETILIGKSLWEIAVTDGIEVDKISFYLLPTLLFLAQHQPEMISTENDTLAAKLAAITAYVNYKKNLKAAREDLHKKIEIYQTMVKKWMSKSKQADFIIDNLCSGVVKVDEKIHPYSSMNLARHSESLRDIAKQDYIDGTSRPCPTAPSSLTAAYENATKGVADSFSHINEYLLWAALGSADKEEISFITNKNAEIRPVAVEFKACSEIEPHARSCFLNMISFLNPETTDLFSVMVDGEERIYFLKGEKGNDDGSYKIVRVDKDIESYIKYNLIGRPESLGKSDNVRGYTFSVHRKEIINANKKPADLINHYVKVHRERLYSALYASGDQKGSYQALWDFVKHMIPFYDCVEGSIKGDASQAVPACLIDAIMFLPVIGQSIGMSTRFAKGLARGITKGMEYGLARETAFEAGRVAIHEVALPTVNDFILLSKNMLRAIDPGFELINSAGNFLTKKLINILAKEEKNAALVTRLTEGQIIKDTPPLPDDHIMARLPGVKEKLPVKKVQENGSESIYVALSRDTGECFGKHYYLEGDMLIPVIRGQHPFLKHISMELADVITEEMFAENIVKSSLAGPDYMGIMHGDNGEMYLCSGYNFLPVIQKMSQDGSPYFFEIVMKDGKNLPIAFDPDMQKFYLNTENNSIINEKWNRLDIRCSLPGGRVKRGLSDACGIFTILPKPSEFSQEEIDLIDKIRIPYDKTKTYNMVENLNKKYYGDGPLFEVTQKISTINPKPPLETLLVEMNGQAVPVEIEIIRGHGIKYYASNLEMNEKHSLVFINGYWVFERSTDASVSMELLKATHGHSYEKALADSHISVPDSNGFRWDSNDNMFIKVKDEYLRVYNSDQGEIRKYLQNESGDKLYIKMQDGVLSPEGSHSLSKKPDNIKNKHGNKPEPGTSYEPLIIADEALPIKLSDKWAIKESVDDIFNELRYSAIGTEGRFKGIYTIATHDQQSASAFEYFILQNEKIYKVRWDSYVHKWRVVNPDHPGLLAYAEPISLNTDNEWVVDFDLPGKGGAPRGLPKFTLPETRNAVKSEFILEKHMGPLEKASLKGNFAVSFRKAGRQTLQALAEGAGAKPHSILEKTIKPSSLEKYYPQNHLDIGKKIKEQGIEGLVGHWDEREGLTGIYLTGDIDVGTPLIRKGSHFIYPLEINDLSGSLTNLKKQKNWKSLCYSGDYDTHDIIIYKGAGRPRKVLSELKEEQEIIDLMNTEIAKVDAERTKASPIYRVIQHGPQVNYPTYMKDHKVDEPGPLSLAVANPGDFPVAMLDRGQWTMINNVDELAEYYTNVGAVIKNAWTRDSNLIYTPDGIKYRPGERQ
ncbi:hypothetical protein ABW286_16810 [Erwinia papayae]|uniref:Uncharacterized protein n=1 Tax=Erwinia papayae TaxID=206499 RepID=A0ABV3N4T7_9GAMM